MLLSGQAKEYMCNIYTNTDLFIQHPSIHLSVKAEFILIIPVQQHGFHFHLEIWGSTLWKQSLFSTVVPSPAWMLSLPHLGSNISRLTSSHRCGSLPHCALPCQVASPVWILSSTWDFIISRQVTCPCGCRFPPCLGIPNTLAHYTHTPTTCLIYMLHNTFVIWFIYLLTFFFFLLPVSLFWM